MDSEKWCRLDIHPGDFLLTLLELIFSLICISGRTVHRAKFARISAGSFIIAANTRARVYLRNVSIAKLRGVLLYVVA